VPLTLYREIDGLSVESREFSSGKKSGVLSAIGEKIDEVREGV
jgi:hypothetical protein